MTTINISLPEPVCDWVNSQVANSQYKSNSDYVLNLIRQDQQRLKKIKVMQALIDEGLASGIVENFDPKTFKQRMLEKARAQL
jgi:antitoxin ParD1/3/4